MSGSSRYQNRVENVDHKKLTVLHPIDRCPLFLHAVNLVHVAETEWILARDETVGLKGVACPKLEILLAELS